MSRSPHAIAADDDAAPHPRADHEQRGAEIERGMRAERRIERVQHRARAREDRERGHHGADERDPESGPSPPESSHAAQRRVCHEVAERHDEESREDERQEHAVRRHRHVVEPGRTEGQLEAGSRQRLHHGHHRAEREGRHRDPDIGQRESRRRWRRADRAHRDGSTMTVPCMR